MPRPETGPRPHVHRQPALGDVPQHGHCFACATYSVTSAPARPDVGHLVAALRHGRLAGQALPAPRTRPAGRTAARPGHRPGASSSPARPAASRAAVSPLPRRPVPALLLIRAVRRWRPRRRGRVPARLPLKILHPACKTVTCATAPPPAPSAGRSAGTPQPAARQLRMRQRSRSSAEGPPGTSGTTGIHHHPAAVNHPQRRVAASQASPRSEQA